MSSLHKHIDPKHLPSVYNGMRPDYSFEDWITNLRNNPEVIKGKIYNNI